MFNDIHQMDVKTLSRHCFLFLLPNGKYVKKKNKTQKQTPKHFNRVSLSLSLSDRIFSLHTVPGAACSIFKRVGSEGRLVLMVMDGTVQAEEKKRKKSWMIFLFLYFFT